MTGKKRTYRTVQADAMAETGRVCPHCGRPIENTPPRPPEMPERSPAAAATRRAQLEPTWMRIIESVAEDLTDVTLEIWIRPLALMEAVGDRLFVAAPTRVAEWIRVRFIPLLERHASKVAGRPITIQVYEDDESAPPAARRQAGEAPDHPSPAAGTETP